jgi:hypothetical protein
VFFFFIGVVGTANAVVYDYNSAIQVRQFENAPSFQNGPYPLYQDIQTVSNLSHTYTSAYGSDIQAYGNLATGSMGTRYNITTVNPGNGQSYVSMFDVLNFDTPSNSSVDVSYSLSLDGSLSYSGVTPMSGYDLGGASSFSILKIYDITGVSNWLEVTDDPDDSLLFTSITPIISEHLGAAVGSDLYIDSYSPYPESYQDLTVDSSGGTIDINNSASGSFTVDPTRQYGIRLNMSSVAIGQAASDFLNTSNFQFTDLNGASFSSESGVFLSDISPSPVPVPAAALLFIPGLLGIIGVARRKKNM